MASTISERYSRRPKMVPPASKTDLVIEAVALAGLLLNIGLIIYGSINLPETIPRHVGLSGVIEAYGSKWITLVTYFILNIFLYTFLTILTRYPYIYNYPITVTEENAPVLPTGPQHDALDKSDLCMDDRDNSMGVYCSPAV